MIIGTLATRYGAGLGNHRPVLLAAITAFIIVSCASSSTPSSTQEPALARTEAPAVQSEGGVTLVGIIESIDGGKISMTTVEGTTLVTINDDSTVNKFAIGAIDGLSKGQRVTVSGQGDETAFAVSSIIVTPEGTSLVEDRGNIQMGRSLQAFVGTIAAIDGQTITLNTRQGSRVATVSAGETSVQMPAATSFSELSPGQLITVVGEESADGAIAARSILITPDLGFLMRGGRPARRGGQAGGRGGAPVTPTETPSLSFNNQRQPGEYEGITFVVAAGSEATFTAKERLALLPLPNAVVMRTEALTGEVHFDGGPSVVEIDLHRLSSDQRLRDGYVRRQMFADHPIATFTLENLGPLPSGFAAGDKVTTQVTGRLNIRGIEVPLSFDVTASDDGDAVNILAETSFVWSDFGLTKPAVSFVLSVDDEVKVRVALALKPIR